MTKKEAGLDINMLLVRQVTELVRGTADFIHESDSSWDILEIEGHLYRLLAVNCDEKAKLAKAFAKKGKTFAKEDKAKQDKMATQTTK